jgi:inorganic triphosphatase YgiF
MDLNILRQGIKKEKGEVVVEDINNLISLFNKRNQIEIEKKYVVVDPQIFDKVRTKLNEYEGYKVHEAEKPFEQVDTYYDTENGFLNKKDITLRIRKKKGKIILTIKTPTVRAKDTSTGTQSTAGQSERFEYEKELERATLEEARNYITKYIPDMSVQSKFNQLKAQMVIKTKRTKMQFSGNDNIKFEIAFDDVRYKRRDKSAHEYEIEMELKSDFIHRINLKMVTDYLESNLSGLSPTRLSKYKRGLNIIDNKSHR